MPYFCRTWRSLSAEMDPMKRPGLRKVGGSALVFFSNESGVSTPDSSGSSQTKSLAREGASVSSCRLPKSIAVPKNHRSLDVLARISSHALCNLIAGLQTPARLLEVNISLNRKRPTKTQTCNDCHAHQYAVSLQMCFPVE